MALATSQGQTAVRARPAKASAGLGWRSAVAPSRLGVPMASFRVGKSAAGRNAAVRVLAAKPDYSAEEFVMPWSPNLVPTGPWKFIDGCAWSVAGVAAFGCPPRSENTRTVVAMSSLEPERESCPLGCSIVCSIGVGISRVAAQEPAGSCHWWLGSVLPHVHGPFLPLTFLIALSFPLCRGVTAPKGFKVAAAKAGLRRSGARRPAGVPNEPFPGTNLS